MKLSVAVSIASVGSLAMACVGACATVPADGRVDVEGPFATEASFGPVGHFLDHRCGSLDCHGSMSRNLRIYGCEGMRLSPNDISNCSALLLGSDTTPDEHQATYLSLMALEPATMTAVMADRGADPDLLTFVRKARGEETHKGGTLITPGDDQDVCITSWLSGATNTQACANALSQPDFPAH